MGQRSWHQCVKSKGRIKVKWVARCSFWPLEYANRAWPVLELPILWLCTKLSLVVSIHCFYAAQALCPLSYLVSTSLGLRAGGRIRGKPNRYLTS